jgi:hypothetical protein
MEGGLISLTDNLGMIDVLDIRYRLGEGITEKSICSCKGAIRQASAFIRPYLPPL